MTGTLIKRSARAIPLALTVLLAAGLAISVTGAEAAPSQNDLDTVVRDTMLSQRGSTAAQAYAGSPVQAPVVERKRGADDWAFGSATIPAPSTTEVKPESALYVAKRSGQRWQVELEGGAGFGALAGQAPESVVHGDEKQAFAAQGNAAAPATGIGLPWRVGDGWIMGGGPHGFDGGSRPFNSIDFNGGDGQVLAPAAGRIYRTCVRNGSAEVRIDHDNGLTTSYYHMTNLTTVPDGARVAAGTYLGHIGTQLPCGGSASGDHVHFSVQRGSKRVAVDGMTFGGWTFHQGNQAYQGFADRAGTQIRVGRGRITNFGPTPTAPTPPAPTPPVPSFTGAADPFPGQITLLNVRSGPGQNFQVVRQLRRGDTVKITCTKRGSSFKGARGTTDKWDRLDNGTFVSDAYITPSSNAPACTA